MEARTRHGNSDIRSPNLAFNVNSNLGIAGLSVSDADDDTLTVTLTASNGTFSLSEVANLTLTDGDGTDDTTLTLEGTIADLNAALATLNFTPNSGFSGEASIDILTSDGELSDMDTIAIAVNAVNIPSVDPPLIFSTIVGDGTSNDEPVVITVSEPNVCELVENPPDFPDANVTDIDIDGSNDCLAW